MNIIIIILLIIVITTNLLILVALLKSIDLKSENSSLKDSISKIKKESEEIFEIQKGDRVIIVRDLDHVSNREKKSIKVGFECEVVDVSINNLKLNAIEAFGNSDVSSIKNQCISFFQNQWEPRTSCDLIITDKHRRDIKLRSLLN